MSPPDARRGPRQALALTNPEQQSDRRQTTGEVNPRRDRPLSTYTDEFQQIRRLWVRRELTELAAVITAGIEDDRPLGEIVWAAEDILRGVVLEVLQMALGDEA